MTRTTRWKGAGGGAAGTESDAARTPPRPPTMSSLQTMTPANTVVSPTTLSWWVLLRGAVWVGDGLCGA